MQFTPAEKPLSWERFVSRATTETGTRLNVVRTDGYLTIRVNTDGTCFGLFLSPAEAVQLAQELQRACPVEVAA